MSLRPLSLLDRWERATATAYARVAARDVSYVGRGVRIDRSVRFTGTRRVQIGAGSVVGARTRLNTEMEGELVIGDNVEIGPNVILDATRELRIGGGTILGPSVYISTGRHRFTGEGAVRYQGGEQFEPIVIGRDVQIGAHVVVLPGATIRDGASVPANSVVGGTVAPDGGG